jgi:hypothetical protein
MTYFNNIMQSQQPAIPGAAGQANAMFQPGFAGTNASEVQYQNQGGFSSASATPTYGMSFGGGIGGAQSMFQPGFANTNVQEVRQQNSLSATPTYGAAFGGGIGGAQSMFQPGFANTNAQEVRQQNSLSAAPQQFGMAFGGGIGGAQSMFQPGFANTNAQEVRQQNAAAPQQFGYQQAQPTNALFNQSSILPQSQPSYQQSIGAGSIFSPGFAGTNIQDVQARNQASFSGQAGFAAQSSYPGYATNAGYSPSSASIFSPGFANTNVQEVRQLNQGGYASAPTANIGLGMQALQAQQPLQAYGTANQSVFTPGFAGTNVQEVRSLNSGQQAPFTGSIFPGSF